jgi:hypothetical protein
VTPQLSWPTTSPLLPAPPSDTCGSWVSLAGPRDWSFQARFVGESKQWPGQKFMPCGAWQYNTSLVAARVYYMRADFAGLLPIFGADVYRAGHGRMHRKPLGLITVADGSEPEFDISELTIHVNDALTFAPWLGSGRSSDRCWCMPSSVPPANFRWVRSPRPR